MPIGMRLWRINGKDLHSVESRHIDAEERLEEWLVGDISMVSDDLLVIGNQVKTRLGGILDILAIDRNGDLAVLELKKGLTPRDVVAQALEYAAWVKTLGWDEIDELARTHHGGTPLAEKFEERFGHSVPDVVNSSHRIYIIAAEMDLVSETIVRYLSEEYGVEINVVFFRYFPDGDDREYLGHSWLMEPSQVEGRDRGRVTRRPPSLTREELEALADQHGVGEIYRALYGFFSERAVRIGRTTSNIAFAFRIGDGTAAAFSMYPDRCPEDGVLPADVRPDHLAEAFSLPEEQVRTGLSGVAETDTGAYGEIHYFKTLDDAHQFITALSGN